MQVAFYQSELDQPHPERTRAILRAHPEVRQLIGRNPFTAAIMVLVLSTQTAIAFAMGRLGWNFCWLSLLIAFCLGAFLNHCMYVIIHDATHNLLFKIKSWNKLVAICADLPNLVPGAIGFGVYHLQHHGHQGDYDSDADMANRWEARLIGNKSYRKARWIQEHYTYDIGQETFSYYGPINLVALNVGYHNEHHDFPSIPWNRLPELRARASEFYDTLKYHTSWSRLLFDFIFDKRYTLFSRVERIKRDDVDPNVLKVIVDSTRGVDLDARWN